MPNIVDIICDDLGSGGWTSPKAIEVAKDAPEPQLDELQKDPGECASQSCHLTAALRSRASGTLVCILCTK